MLKWHTNRMGVGDVCAQAGKQKGGPGRLVRHEPHRSKCVGQKSAGEEKGQAQNAQGEAAQNVASCAVAATWTLPVRKYEQAQLSGSWMSLRV